MMGYTDRRNPPLMREDSMKPEAFLRLEQSETAVVHAASRIFSAYVSSGQVNASNEEDMVQKAIRTAIRMAVTTDRLVQSDEEKW